MNDTLKRISDKLIAFHREKYDESISPMKLQKLCYYAQGFYIALNNKKELFPNDFQAWQHGPVIKELYNEYKSFKWKPIDTDISLEKYENNLDEDNFLHDIISYFGSYDGATLSAMTHKETPWLEARGGISDIEPSNAIITKENLYDYFIKQIA